jgi:hypothetical protein
MISSYSGQVAFDAVRCLAVAAGAFGIGWPIGARLPQTRWSAVILLAALLTPALLVSYAYAPLSLRLTGAPALLLTAYSCLLTLKLSCLAALARWLLPPSLPREAIYCANLIEGRSVPERIVFAVRTASATPWIVLVVVFLLAFGDFELASLLSVRNWAVQLFDAHAGGLELRSSLQRVALPLAIEVLLLGAVLLAGRGAPPQASPAISSSIAPKWPITISAAIAAIAAFIPLGIVVVQAARAFTAVPYGVVMWEEIGTSLAFAIAGAGLAWIVASMAGSVRGGVLLIVPGLLGALVLSLLVLALFQTWPLQFAYDTPAPLTLALALLLAPIAFLLRWLIRTHQPRESLHLARMAGVRRLLWDLDLSRRVAAVGLVFLLAYFELTASALLMPVRLTPAFVRLHNLSHYGQTSILSLMLLVATLAPAALLALTLGLGRLYARRDAR